MIGTVVLFTLAPVLAMAVGGVIAAFRAPTPKLGSAIQHFAAGVVFSALAVEVLPDIMHRHAPWAVLGGFSAGVLLMLGLRMAGCRVQRSGGSSAAGMAFVVGTDVLIDGVLIGVAFAAGAREGGLIAVALAMELLSLGLATSASLTRGGSSRAAAIGILCALALLPMLGAVAGNLLLGGLGGGWMEAVLALAAATFLYLVTEELLVEAHEVPEDPWMTAMFFAGFVALLLIAMAGG